MKWILLAFMMLNFLSFIGGAFLFFSPPTDNQRQRNLSSLLILGCMVGICLQVASLQEMEFIYFLGGMLFLLLSLVLFLYTAITIRGHTFSPIHSGNTPDFLLARGPYRYIRHPFYSAYLLTFLGGVWGSANNLALIWLLLAFHIYSCAAEEEEDKFFRSPLGKEYASYRARVGKFFPKL